MNKLPDDLENMIELAGFKGHEGIETLASASTISRNMALDQKLSRILEVRAAMATETIPFPSPGDDELPARGILLGKVVRMDGSFGPQVYLPLDVLCRFPHILISGSSGAGKSTAMSYLATRFTGCGWSVLMLDTEDDYMNLMAYLPAGRCWVLDDRTIKRNPLQSLPGQDERRTFGRMKRVFREAFLRDGSIGLLGEELISLSLSSDGEQAQMTLRGLLNRLNKARYRLDARRGQYLESLKNRLGNVVEFVDIYDCAEGFDIRNLLGPRCTVLRLGSLSDELKDFVVNDLVAALQDWTSENSLPAAGLVVCIDEAHRFFSPSKAIRYDLGDPLLLDAARTFRKRGCTMALSSQLFRDIPAAALANISTLLAFRTSEGSCMKAVTEAMSLSRDQMDYLPKLGERRALLKHPLVAEPFIIELPVLDFSHALSEAEITQRMEPVLASLRWVPVKRAVAEAPGHQEVAQAKAGTRPEATGDGSMLSHGEVAYLAAIAKDPFLGSTVRDRKNGIALGTGAAMRKRLVQAGCLVLHRMKLPGTGRSGAVTCTEITIQGWDELKLHRVEGVSKPAGRGSWLHTYWQAAIKAWLEAHHEGSRPRIETTLNGKALDLVAKINGRLEAFEVVMNADEWNSREKELKNILKDLEVVGVSKVHICAEDEQALARIKEHVLRDYENVITDKHLGKVEWRLLGDFSR